MSFCKGNFQDCIFWLLIFRGASRNPQVAIRAKWQGKAFHVHPVKGLTFLQRKFSGLYYLVANFHGRLWKPIVCHMAPVFCTPAMLPVMLPLCPLCAPCFVLIHAPALSLPSSSSGAFAPYGEFKENEGACILNPKLWKRGPPKPYTLYPKP